MLPYCNFYLFTPFSSAVPLLRKFWRSLLNKLPPGGWKLLSFSHLILLSLGWTRTPTLAFSDTTHVPATAIWFILTETHSTLLILFYNGGLKLDTLLLLNLKLCWFQITMQQQWRKKLALQRGLGKRQEKLGEDGDKEWGRGGERKWLRIRGRDQHFCLRNKKPYPECRYELFLLQVYNQ